MRPSREEPSRNSYIPRDTRKGLGRRKWGHRGQEGQADGENEEKEL